MRVLAESADVAKVTACLSNGWEFLSGESRLFDRVYDVALAPQLAEFCYFMPLSELGKAAVGGVAVFIELPDANTIAAHMFGESPPDLHINNLNDACSEACNVLAMCVTLNLATEVDVDIGLPFRADSVVFDQICSTCEPIAIYKCNTLAGQIFVIAYDIANQS